MKRIGITMRVEYHSDINERRDALDQRWCQFLRVCNLLPIFLPNEEGSLLHLDTLHGIILTGGNCLASHGGDAIERDNLEEKLITHAVESHFPLLGVCRGMQMIQSYFGVQLKVVPNHVAVYHNINMNDVSLNVNSYHKYGALDSTNDLMIDAKSEDGVIEAVSHKEFPIRGIMWHPEREKNFSESDIQLFKNHFQL
ncbi:MAG: gamma-glutamyl-gamma-aminobutyrate hydrolase family protein [Alphaproteobacteria bacterium]